MGGFLFATITIIICLVVLDQIVYFLKGESTFIETQLSMQQQWQRQKKKLSRSKFQQTITLSNINTINATAIPVCVQNQTVRHCIVAGCRNTE